MFSRMLKRSEVNLNRGRDSFRLGHHSSLSFSPGLLVFSVLGQLLRMDEKYKAHAISIYLVKFSCLDLYWVYAGPISSFLSFEAHPFPDKHEFPQFQSNPHRQEIDMTEILALQKQLKV